ncbi:TIGR03016 family PEP-CTERM system-associated outer membrane protein [Denitromonas iodatirespirans]|uniref:TIGR03016 family PEP-CTERM system-associated outer membrane protein n=1 Tax=Denitromonas iodatirespirans TaxID=2795389 RepID=A0A944D605_DENI1|nr:TIGR03016 family PEP-CTERM system-associated outer membrane protein [Denitromonas iodatirespirans]MBT0960615.1 TIGR03016 family PEP-CTERM system-associated outer membrane protein [Denitromonas iodatirespirans]
MTKPPEFLHAIAPLAVAAACCMAGGAWAQSVVQVTPSISSRLTFTDNVNASSNSESDWLLEVSPGIAVRRDSGRVNGNFDASLRNVVYANSDDRNTTFLALRGRGEVEAIEQLLFVDLGASISRNNQSLFSGRSSDDPLNTSADNEVRSFNLGPRLEFAFGNSAKGRLAYNNHWLSGGGSTLSNRRTETLTGMLEDGEAFGPFGWSLSYDKVNSHYRDNDTEATRENGRLGVSYTVTPQFILRASVGRESNNYNAGRTDEGTTHGYGFDWFPTTRTSVTAFTEERLFGRGYDIKVSHRGPRSSWRLSYVRDYTSSEEVIAESLEDYYYQLIFDSLAGQGLSNVQRDVVARALLQQSGLTGSGLQVGFITNAQYVSRNLRGDFTLSGVRNTLTVSLYRTERSRLAEDLIVSATDDFRNFDQIRDTGMIVSLNHKLSGLSTLTASVGRNNIQGSGVTSQDNKRTTLNLGVSRRLGPKSTGGLTYRHQKSTGSSDFTENALTATLGVRF